MNKISSVFLGMLCLLGLGCGNEYGSEANGGISEDKGLKLIKKSDLDAKSVVAITREGAFNASLGTENVKGVIDRGAITIDYPLELHGSIKLLRFDGSTKPHVLPFAKSHCDDIHSMAKHGAGLMVRTAYRSVLSFEIPVVVSSSFVAELTKKSQSFGYLMQEITIKNPILYYQGVIKIFLDEDSIAHSIGNVEYLEEQLNLSTKGTDIDLSHKKLIVISGDIICDLASKLARIEMTYPVKGDNKTIKVVFDSLDPSMTL